MTKNIETNFPKVLSFNSLITHRAIPIKDMTYFKLEINEKVGIYRPLEEDENGKIRYYKLRNTFSKQNVSQYSTKEKEIGVKK